MHSLTAFAILALSSVANALPQGGIGICTAPIFTGTPPYIFASSPGTDVTNLQLGGSPNGPAVLEASGFNTRMTFDDSQIGVYDGSCSPLYLDIGDTVSGTTYKALTWTYGENTASTTWVANYSETITTSTPNSLFVACGETDGVWTLYLGGAGLELPAGCVPTALEVSANGLHEVGTK
ncbi:hypothetical protein FRB94_000348 [Tulasnella sp. JGI-2019a]|nr:hypothetical protein FRB93_006653 [Tulasnella sp. JGI-2019a]KAG9006843.1 hypothetical protein FRB94_000348 [Tulasnella sp. JGI-2019a]KAG9028734.1 hypothetical protein FRB95_006139 [Tulasnella sp. JGI-2019a]